MDIKSFRFKDPLKFLSASALNLDVGQPVSDAKSKMVAEFTIAADEFDKFIAQTFSGVDAVAVVRPRIDELIKADDLEGAMKLSQVAAQNMEQLIPPNDSAANKIREQMGIPLGAWLLFNEGEIRKNLGISKNAWNKHSKV